MSEAKRAHVATLGPVPVFGDWRVVVLSAEKGGSCKRASFGWPKRSIATPLNRNRRIGFGTSTIERWYYKAKSAPDPIARSGPKDPLRRRDALVDVRNASGCPKGPVQGPPPLECPAALRQPGGPCKRAKATQTGSQL